MEFGKRAQQTGGSQKTASYQLARELFGAMDALLRCRIFLEYSPRWVDVLNPATNQLVTKVPQSTQQVLNNHQLLPLQEGLLTSKNPLVGDGASS